MISVLFLARVAAPLPAQVTATDSGRIFDAPNARLSRETSDTVPTRATHATDAAFFAFGRNRQYRVDLTFIQPGSFIFYDRGTDDEGEVDLYKDGKLAIAVQLAGADFGWSPPSRKIRFGVNGGVGVSSASTGSTSQDGEGGSRSGSVLMMSGSGFIQFKNLFRYEVGFMRGISALEGLSGTQRSDTALFFGVTLKTTLGEELENLIR